MSQYRVIARQDDMYYAYQREDENNREIYWTKRIEDAEHFETVSRLSAHRKKFDDKNKKITHYLLSVLPKSRAVIVQVKEVLIANRKMWATSVFEDLVDLEQVTEGKPL